MRITFAIISFLGLAPMVAWSDDLLSCVDRDVVATLLSSVYLPGAEITDEMPREFASIRFPDSFDFIGSMTSDHATIVAFRTELDPDGAESVATRLLGEQGWQPAPRPQDRVQPGFQPSREAGQHHSRYCHSDGSAVSVTAKAEERGTYVTAFSAGAARNTDCRQQPDADGSIRWGFTDDLMPKLELPPDSTTRGSGHGGIIQSSGDDADTHVRLITELEPEELLEHFSKQLATQSWMSDSSWIGQSSQGSTWLLSRDGLPRTVGNLNIVKHSKGDYTVRFSMIAM